MSCSLVHWITFLHKKCTVQTVQQSIFYRILISLLILFLWTVYEEPEDPSNRSFFSEIISSVSDVKFSHSGRYMLTRDYLTVKVWDLNMETKPVETYQVSISYTLKCNNIKASQCLKTECFHKFLIPWSDKQLAKGAANQGSSNPGSGILVVGKGQFQH